MDELCLKKAREKALLQKAYLQSILVSKISYSRLRILLVSLLSLMIERRSIVHILKRTFCQISY